MDFWRLTVGWYDFLVRVLLIGDDYGILVETIDTVPDAVSPVKVPIQLPDGDKSMLMQAWRVSVPNSISSSLLSMCSVVRGRKIPDGT